jgi:hypothetical protein
MAASLVNLLGGEDTMQAVTKVHLEILITDMSRIVIFTSFLSWKNLFETV